MCVCVCVCVCVGSSVVGSIVGCGALFGVVLVGDLVVRCVSFSVPNLLISLESFSNSRGNLYK